MKTTLQTLQILINNEVNNVPQINTQNSLYEDVKKSKSFIRLEKKTNEESIKYACALFKCNEKDNNRTKNEQLIISNTL